MSLDGGPDPLHGERCEAVIEPDEERLRTGLRPVRGQDRGREARVEDGIGAPDVDELGPESEGRGAVELPGLEAFESGLGSADELLIE